MLQQCFEPIKLIKNNIRLNETFHVCSSSSLTPFYVHCGFTSNKNEILKACCASNAPYNVDVKILCGTPGTTVCSDPSKQINWNEAHLTEAAYRMIAKGLVEGSFETLLLKPLLSR
jgi:hypothetical protein